MKKTIVVVAVMATLGLTDHAWAQNAVAAPSSPGEFAAFINAEQAKWGPVVARTGVKLD